MATLSFKVDVIDVKQIKMEIVVNTKSCRIMKTLLWLSDRIPQLFTCNYRAVLILRPDWG